MKIGYMRVSKSDGSQNTDLQLDALVAEGVDKDRMYQDLASSSSGIRCLYESLTAGKYFSHLEVGHAGTGLEAFGNTGR